MKVAALYNTSPKRTCLQLIAPCILSMDKLPHTKMLPPPPKACHMHKFRVHAAEVLLNGNVRERQAEAQRASPPVVREASQGPAVSNHHEHLRRKDGRKHVPPTTLLAKKDSRGTTPTVRKTPCFLELNAGRKQRPTV